MPRTTEYENPMRLKMIRELEKAGNLNEAPIWKMMAEQMSRSRKNRREVNIRKINEYTKEGDVVAVPGKVLGDGYLDHEVTVSAFSFSDDAKNKILKTGDAISISELIERNPKGSNIKIIC